MTASSSTAPTDLLPPAPPGPRGLPVMGNALQLSGRDVLAAYTDLWRQYGDVIGLKLGPLNACLLAHPDHVHHVLVKNQKNYIKGLGYDGFRLLVGQGLVTSDGDLWRQQRRLMQPPFTPTAISRYAAMMAEVTDRLLVRWETAAQRGEPVNVDAEMMRLTMSVIGRAMFSLDLGEALAEVGAAFQSAFAFIPEQSLAPVKLPLWAPFPKQRRFRHDLEVINRFVSERIQAGRQQPGEDLLGLLLRAQDEETGARMSEQQLRDEVITLFFAGFETTARTLTWAWYLLSRHPQAAEATAAEARRVLGGRRPAMADVPELKYTRMVVDETLRLYPPTALLARQNLEADTIGGYQVPARTLVILIPHLVHRHPSVWPDPERFDPERFAPAAVDARSKNAYIPFASGPRVCLGNSFALLEMVFALAMALERFRVEPTSSEPIPAEFAGATRPTRPLWLKVHQR